MTYAAQLSLEDAIARRFWPKVDVRGPDECWTWTASRSADGYGHFKDSGPRGIARSLLAHRVSYALANGAIPRGMLICHTCDNPPCVNPAHLYAGTAANNTADKLNRGRMVVLPGSQNGHAILTEALVSEIRSRCAAGESQKSLASAFGVSQQTISSVVTRVAWRHVP